MDNMEKIDINARGAGDTGKKKGPSKKKKSWKRFWIGLGIYAGILIVLVIIFQIYTNMSLRKYEESQSVYAMQKYFDDFKAAIEKGKLPENIAHEGMTDVELLEKLKGKTLTFEKAKNSYSSEKPRYVIKADGEDVITVGFEGYNEEVIFAILTVLDWKVTQEKAIAAVGNNESIVAEAETSAAQKETKVNVIYIEPETSEEITESPVSLNSYIIKVPSTFTVFADGQQLSADNMLPETENLKLLEFAAEYVAVPVMVKYAVNSSSEPVITVKDQNGYDAIVSRDGNTFTASYTGIDAVPDSYRTVALEIAEKWSLLMTNDLSGGYNGFNEIVKCLIKDSYYYQMAYQWVNSEDITFTSPHTLYDPPFVNVSVKDLVVYNDFCFSCHVGFEKYMYLTKTTGVEVDTTDSTFVYVYYDDSDDGVDNPHWSMVYME